MVPGTYKTDTPIPPQLSGKTISYKVFAYDNDTDNNRIADRTQGNASGSNILITDDDTAGPVISLVNNDLPFIGRPWTSFNIYCSISDLATGNSGVYDDNTGSAGQGIYLIWTNDGWTTSNEIKMSWDGLEYKTDQTIPGQAAFAQINFQIYAYDNDFDNSLTTDRTQTVRVGLPIII
jgi:hypothetical protein